MSRRNLFDSFGNPSTQENDESDMSDEADLSDVDETFSPNLELDPR